MAVTGQKIVNKALKYLGSSGKKTWKDYTDYQQAQHGVVPLYGIYSGCVEHQNCFAMDKKLRMCLRLSSG